VNRPGRSLPEVSNAFGALVTIAKDEVMPSGSETATDVIDTEAGVEPGSRTDILRRRRPHAREQSQAAFTALFGGPGTAGFSLDDRLAVADFVVRIGSVPGSDSSRSRSTNTAPGR
jgi:uncharacterized protein YciW